MNVQTKPLGSQPWETVRGKLDQALPFANMRGTPYYRDAVYEQFSAQGIRPPLRRAAGEDEGTQA